MRSSRTLNCTVNRLRAKIFRIAKRWYTSTFGRGRYQFMNEVMDHEVMEPPAKRACQQLDHIIETGISVSCLPRSVAVGRCGWQVSLNGHNSQPLAQSNGNFQNFAPGHWVQRSNRRATCGLYMPTYGGYENLRGEILTVTIDKRRRPSLGLDILVVHCGGGNVKAVIQSVQVKLSSCQ